MQDIVSNAYHIQNAKLTTSAIYNFFLCKFFIYFIDDDVVFLYIPNLFYGYIVQHPKKDKNRREFNKIKKKILLELRLDYFASTFFLL